jgi:hypothetical protein
MYLRGSTASGLSVRVLLIGAVGVSAMPVAACSSSAGDSSAGGNLMAQVTEPATVPPSASYYKNDNDQADNDGVGGDDQRQLAEYGTRPTAVEYNAIATIIKRYLSVALIEDGTDACPMLYAGFRTALLELHRPPSPSRRRVAQDCPALMTMEFTRHHSQLASYDLSTMVIADAHVKNGFGIAVLGFKSAPEREILFAREGSSWKIDSILDSELT